MENNFTIKDLESAWTAGSSHFYDDLTFEKWFKNKNIKNNIQESLEDNEMIYLGKCDFYNIALEEHIKKHGPAEDMPQDIIDSIKDGSFFHGFYFD